MALYEIWIADPTTETTSEGFGGYGFWYPMRYTDHDNERVELPLPWAIGVAEELAELDKTRVEVRGTGKDFDVIKAVFG